MTSYNMCILHFTTYCVSAFRIIHTTPTDHFTKQYSFSVHSNGYFARFLWGEGKGKAVPLQAWNGPEVSRKFRLPDFMTTAQGGGRFVSLTHRPPLPPGNTPGTHFCQRLCRPQDHSATGRFTSLKNSKYTIGNLTRDLPVCNVVP